MTQRHYQIFWIIVVFLVTAMAFTAAVIFNVEAEKEVSVSKARHVEVIRAKKSDAQVAFSSYGTVQADREVTLQAEVSGRIVDQSAQFVPGGIVKKGEMLIRIDRRDYLNAVEQEKAAVERARFELEVEKGRQVVARREWEELSTSLSMKNISEELALRKPHLREKEASLAAAQSRLAKARIDLSRTEIVSPMDAVVVTETLEIGDYVTPLTEIATLAATDVFRVQTSVPMNRLSWIKLPKNGEGGSLVVVSQDLGNQKVKREAKILRLLGNLEESGRMARVLVEVKDPLGLEKQQVPLLIGAYVRVDFAGPLLKGVYTLPRSALKEEDKVLIMNENNRLEIRKVNVVFRDAEKIIVDEGLMEGDKVILSTIAVPLPGMELSE